ncbi:DUF4291 domain-containing protein [Phytomonospora sp. NPDC050363]|uniref:DUF4291 domain-containing protein n=1 Tax=Phytomonospora sp. NPDC050363 TaxID=3155642 RepID=UPI0033C71219
MTAQHEIRADFDESTIVVYQAYPSRVADAALAAGTFVPPFSYGRMTWIKPSFRWLMHRSDWARKVGQNRILAVRISREGWETALGAAALTSADTEALARADVHVQWDPERSLRGAPLNFYSIQVGVGRGLIRAYAEEWVRGITDLTPRARRIAGFLRAGEADKARRLLPPERVYPLGDELAAGIGAGRLPAGSKVACVTAARGFRPSWKESAPRAVAGLSHYRRWKVDRCAIHVTSTSSTPTSPSCPAPSCCTSSTASWTQVRPGAPSPSTSWRSSSPG